MERITKIEQENIRLFNSIEAVEKRNPSYKLSEKMTNYSQRLRNSSDSRRMLKFSEMESSNRVFLNKLLKTSSILNAKQLDDERRKSEQQMNLHTKYPHIFKLDAILSKQKT